MSTTDLLFFFSYATDDDDPHLDQFFADLESEVRRLSGRLKDQQVGFRFQRDNEVGDSWPARLLLALDQARVLVAVYSPSYFGKAYCGREVAAFLHRRAEHENAHGRRPAAILPLIWLPLRRPLPARIADLHYADRHYGETYANEGLQYIKTLKRFEDEYRQFVRQFARRIINAGEEHSLTPLPNGLDITTLPSAFDDAADSTAAPASTPGASGPGVVSFAIVTATARGAWDWAPYTPPEANRIGPLSFGIALNLQFKPQQIDISAADPPRLGQDAVSREFLTYLRSAWQRNEIVVVLVDGSSLLQPACRTLMEAYDQSVSYVNCAALVVWPAELTSSERRQVDQVVRDTFRNKRATSNPVYFRQSITSSQELKDAIADTLRAVQIEVLGRAEDPTAPAFRMPSLDATAGRGSRRA